ncbi:hypothetical protein [Actinoplanes sp. NPDC048796]
MQLHDLVLSLAHMIDAQLVHAIFAASAHAVAESAEWMKWL